MKKIISIFTITILMVSAAVVGSFAEGHIAKGYRGRKAEVYKVPGTSNKRFKAGVTDKKYNSATESWFPQHVRKKDQNPHGTCWAFAATSAADISYAKETNNSNVTRTSPGHFAYFVYNRVVDPLGLTTGDKTVAGGEWCEVGGSQVDAFQALANRMGLAAESKAPYTSLSKDGYSCRGNHRFDDSLAYDLSYQLENATLIQYEDLSGDEMFDSIEDYNKCIKEEILEHGAVASSLFWEDAGFETQAFYNTNFDPYGGDHAITIVGWDDDYSKSNFAKYNGQSTPANDGAWICLNSWGEEFGAEDLGKGGLFYVSYEDQMINYNGVASFDMEQYKEAEDLYQYDGSTEAMSLPLDADTKAANVFKVQGKNKNLNRIGFTEWNEGQTNYKVCIYDNLKDKDNPESGTKIATKSVNTKHPGYYSFDLDEPVKITDDGYYSVVIEFEDTVNFGVEMDIPAYREMYEVNTDNEQSYLYDEYYGGWTNVNDTTSYSTDLRIKAYANTIKEKQTINVLTSQEYEFGQTGQTIGATITKGTGTISYGVKSGLDVLDVDKTTGEMTFKKPGKAEVIVTASANDMYNEETQIVTVTVNKVKQTISVNEFKEYELGQTGQTIGATITKGTGTISYSVKSGSDVLDVDKTTGEMTFKKAGIAVITVVASGNDTYSEVTQDIIVKTNKVKQAISVKELQEYEFGQTGQTIGATITKGTGTISYGVKSGSDILEVDNTTGEMTFKKAGTALVVITASENDTFLETVEEVAIVVKETKKKDEQVLSVIQEYEFGQTGKKLNVSLESGAGEISYTVKSGSDVLDVDKTTGEMTFKKAGLAVITVTASANDTYNETTQDVIVRVNKAKQVISVKKLQEYGVGQKNKKIGATGTGDGTLHYELKNGTSVSVNQDTGDLDIKGPGVSVIVVKKEGTEQYEEVTAEVVINVIGNPSKISGLKATSKKKQLTVSFKKDMNAIKYQISVSTSKKKTVVKKTTTKLKETIKKLKSKKNYYVKVRGVDKFGTYGLWSNINKVKVK